MTSTNYMFYGCSSLISLDLPNFNTKNVTNMRDMFYGCKSLDLSNFNTQNVTSMEGLFTLYYSLISLDLSYFNTKNVINMTNIFTSCRSINQRKRCQ